MPSKRSALRSETETAARRCALFSVLQKNRRCKVRAGPASMCRAPYNHGEIPPCDLPPDSVLLLWLWSPWPVRLFRPQPMPITGQIWLWELKGGWFIGGSAGGGTLLFHGRRYPLSVGGVSAGLVFGGSETKLQGTVSNIRSPSDVAGVYGAAGAGVAIGVGARMIVLRTKRAPCCSFQAGRSACSPMPM